MQLIVQLRPELAAELHTELDERECSEATSALRVAVQSAGCRLSALHPGASDLHLLTYFQIETANRQTAELLQRRLAACEGVEAAYVKPTDEIP